MRIGITYDLKEDVAAHGPPSQDGPDDLQEEFDSPATIDAIIAVIRGLGHEVEKLGDGRELLERLLANPPDFVFNFAEGLGVGRCREARVPAVLEMLGIPYTGSDPLTLAVTLDKDCAKRLVQSVGVPVAPGMEIRDPAGALHIEKTHPHIRFPIIVKPAWEGSSKGIRANCLVDRPENLPGVLAALGNDYRQPILLEEYIEGDELTVGILGNDPPQIMGMMRILPTQPTERFIYSLEIKRDFQRLVHYESPPRIGSEAIGAISDAALKAYQVLGCRDVSRIDFRLREGIPYFLEVNPLPGLNPLTSDLVILARLCNWSYDRLIETILQSALDRHQLNPIPLRNELWGPSTY